jgi:hypothetical protein
MEKKAVINGKERTLVYLKYDAISVEGPETAKNNKQFYKCLFEENADENGGYASQSRGYVKNFFEDTHSMLFKKCEAHMNDENKKVRIIAAKDAVTVNPYYMYDRDGKEMIDTVTGKCRIGQKLSIFLLPDEDAEGEIRRRSRTLKFVPIEDTDENDEEEKEKTIAGKK